MESSALNDTVLRLAALAYLGRYTGVSRTHSESDLRIFFTWCHDRELAPLAAVRAQIELYVRWMQEVRRFKPSTVSRRMSVVTGFYRTCVIDAVLEHGHRVLRVVGKGGKIVLVPLPPAVGRSIDRAVGERDHGPILLNRRGVRMDRHCATRRLRRLSEVSVVRLPRMHPHMLRHTFVTTMLDAGVDLRDVQIAARHADPRTTMRYDRAPQEPRPAPELHPGGTHGIHNLTLCPAEDASSGQRLHARALVQVTAFVRAARSGHCD